MIIFCDFDGTAAVNDVGRQFYHRFGDVRICLQAVERWLNDEISSRECFEIESDTVSVTAPAFDAFCDQQPLSPGFVEFAGWCRQQQHDLVILSDGMDYYIKRILQRYGLELPFYSNQASLQPANRLKVSFPYYEHTCGKCANCKRYQVRRLTPDGIRAVYIGDGYSDRCGAELADILFAKRDLARWCAQKEIAFHAFTDFHDILSQMQHLTS